MQLYVHVFICMFFINASEDTVHNVKVMTSIMVFGDSWKNCNEKWIQANLGDIVGSVPDHCNKADIAVDQVIRIFWLQCAYKSYVYTIW